MKDSQDNILVSVIIPTYYRNDTLSRSIESVINQTYSNIELIVVDDSGEKYAEDVVRRYDNIIYIHHNCNQGPNAARSTGIDRSNGDYIQFLDDDDILFPTKIEKHVDLITGRDECGVAYCAYKRENGSISRQLNDPDGGVLEQALAMTLTCITSTMLIDKRIAEKITSLPDLPGSTDTFWKIEFSQKTNFCCLDEILVRKGIAPQQVSDSWGAISGTWMVLDRYEQLYEKYPSKVRKSAKAKAARREAKYHLNNKVWSYRAIKLSIYSAYSDPNNTKYTILLPILSILGQPGYKILNVIAHTYNRKLSS